MYLRQLVAYIITVSLSSFVSPAELYKLGFGVDGAR